jgi:hypothetical protein
VTDESRPVVVLATGSRYWSDPGPVRRVIDQMTAGSVLIHGDGDGKDGNPGLDQLAGKLAAARGLTVGGFPANWVKHGKSAGPKRNAAMALFARSIDYCVAFPLPGSSGTWDMVRKARAAGIRTFVYRDGKFVPEDPPSDRA